MWPIVIWISLQAGCVECAWVEFDSNASSVCLYVFGPGLGIAYLSDICSLAFASVETWCASFFCLDIYGGVWILVLRGDGRAWKFGCGQAHRNVCSLSVSQFGFFVDSSLPKNVSTSFATCVHVTLRASIAAMFVRNRWYVVACHWKHVAYSVNHHFCFAEMVEKMEIRFEIATVQSEGM